MRALAGVEFCSVEHREEELKRLGRLAIERLSGAFNPSSQYETASPVKSDDGALIIQADNPQYV